MREIWGRSNGQERTGRAGVTPAGVTPARPGSDYILTLSTLIVSPSIVPEMVTLWPAWATTLSWFEILYTLPSLTKTAGAPPLMQRAAQAAWSSLSTLSGVLPAHVASAI